MSTYFFLLVFLWWLLLLTFVPALATGLTSVRRMAGMTWQKGLVAGLVEGTVRVAGSIGWYWVGVLTPSNDVSVVGFFTLPIPSAATAWGICRFWQRRLVQ